MIIDANGVKIKKVFKKPAFLPFNLFLSILLNIALIIGLIYSENQLHECQNQSFSSVVKKELKALF